MKSLKGWLSSKDILPSVPYICPDDDAIAHTRMVPQGHTLAAVQLETSAISSVCTT